MIDFRYHLVSIASVFLALAVGIVLGAGPLKGTISDTLTSEVTKLREDANALRAELNTAEAQVKSRDGLITELRPRATAGLLTGEHVTLITLPGAPDALVDAAREVLAEAGATTGTTINIEPSWVSQEPPDVTDRGAAAAELRALLSGDLPVGVAPERVLSLTLAAALTGADLDAEAEHGLAPAGELAEESGEEPTAAGTASVGTEPGADPTAEGSADAPEGAATEPPSGSEATAESPDLTVPGQDRAEARRTAQVLEILTGAGLVTMDSETTPTEASAVVLLTADSVDDEAVADSEQPTMPGWLDLVTVFAAAGPLTLAGDVPAEEPVLGNVIAAVRDTGELAGGLSSIDNLRTPIGRVSLPLTVAQQLAGADGHYGELDTAGALFPTLPVDAP